MSADAPFLKGIICHAWNKDKSQLAIAPNGSDVFIYSSPGTDPAKWQKKHILTEHEGFVSALDWNAQGQLVTCGHDRNAYVWEYESKEDTWRPTLVILRINRGATAVAWSPSGKKFAVGSNAKSIPVCSYEDSNNWWISKMIKHHKSSVTSLGWSPNSRFLVSGSTDFKCRIFSAFFDDLDQKEDDAYGSLFPKQYEFGELLMELGQAKSWVNASVFSPSGFNVAFAGHGSSLTFVNIQNGKSDTVNVKSSPYLDIQYIDENTLVAVGFDMQPVIYTQSGGSWSLSRGLDSQKKEDAKGAQNAQSAARNKFQAADNKGQKFGDVSEKVIQTRHTNTITNVRVISSKLITTCGLDGRVLHWDL